RAGYERWLLLADEIASSVANHALGLVGESWRRERLAGDSGSESGAANTLRWAEQRAAAGSGFSPLAVFEQAVADGHPLHPCARIRGGMAPEEVLAYAPEWADEVPLGVVAISTTSFKEVSSGDRAMTALLRRRHPSAVEAAAAHLRSM